MKHFSNQSNGSHVGRMNYGGAKFCRFALFPLMLLMLLLLPGRMVAQTEYDNTVTFTALEGNPEGYTDETYAELFDGRKTEDDFSKWCCDFDGSAYVIFQASKAGVPVGYTITTGNDNSYFNGRNPESWKLYGNNEGKDGTWTLIQEVSNDTKLQDMDYTPYDFTCEGSTSYKYFKWEISAIHSEDILQVGEFELKLQTCSHKNGDGSSALGEAIETVEATCTEHGYTTKECSICHLIMKEYKDDDLKPHTLTHHEAKATTCTETGKEEYWQCSVCKKLFSDKDATTEITDAGKLEIPANGHKFNSEGTCTVCQYKDSRYALFNGLDGITDVTITDNGNPWKKLDLKADGMDNLGFTIPEDSKGLMSSNYNVDVSSSETVIKFNVSKPILLTSQVLVSSETSRDYFCIYVDNKLDLRISGQKQTEYKVLLPAGDHSLKLCYQKDEDIKEYADRAFIYDLKTATTFSEYVAEYDATNNTLIFKDITSSNLGDQSLDNIVMMCKAQTVSEMCSFLKIEKWAIKNIVFDKSFNTYAPTSLNSFFMDLTKLETIKDLKFLNTENVENMTSMFDGCKKLSSLDLSNFNTAKVENMQCMFYYCQSLSSLDLSSFNTAKVANMAAMFKGCSALTTIYAGDKFVTTKVLYSSDMFYECPSLKGAIMEYDASKIDRTYANCGTNGYFTPVYEYAEFDEGTGTLTFRRGLSKPAGAYDLNVESNNLGWNAQKENIEKVVFDASFANARPTSCYRWFDNCYNLTEIVGIENLNTQNVTDMSWMFNCCYALTSLDVSNFNTEKVTNMSNMFGSCEKLSSLDLSNFNTERVEKMSHMFSVCSTLQTIFASDKFVTNQVFDGDGMFFGCENLKGFIDYISNKDKDNYKYANYTTGYFTKLVGKNGEKKIGAAGEALTTENLVLDDGKDFVAYDQFAAKNAFYIRVIPEGSTWGTLCLPFSIDQSQETECKFYRLTGIDNDNECITLESCEGAEIPAGTPVLFKMNEGEQTLSISAQDASIVTEPKAGTNTDVNLVGSFTKIGGKDNQGLADTDYIIGKDKFWRVSELKKDGNSKGVGIKPMRAYIQPATASQARAAMLSIGKGDGTTAIDNLNAISNDANAEYYDANGRRTNGLQKGLNIVKRGSKTYKIMVK